MESAELDALWDFNDPAGSEARFRQIGSPEALTQVARTLGLQARFAEGHAVLDDLGEPGGIVGARLLLERGRLFNSSGDPTTALSFFERALQEAQKAGAEYYAVDAAHMVAICKNETESHLQAISMAKAAADPRAKTWDASLLNNLGWTHFEEGNHSAALGCFEEGLRLREMRGEADRARIAKWCVARCLRELGQVDEALQMQYSLLPGTDGYVYEEIGECLLSQQNLHAARPYMEAAAKLLHDGDSEQAKRRAEIGNDSAFAEVQGNQITVVRHIDAPRDAIWDLVYSPAGLSFWLGEAKEVGSESTVDGLKEGTVFDLWIDGKSSDLVRCRVVKASDCVVTYRWQDASDLTLSVDAGAVTLTHFAEGDLASYAAAWHSALDLLRHVLQGGTRETFAENYDALLPEYRRLLEQDRI